MTTTVPPSWTVIPSSRAVSTSSRAQVGAVRVGGRDVRRLRPVVEGVRAARGAVDELVADDERAQLELGLQRARRARADQPPDAELAHRPDVRAVRDLRGRKLVRPPVPWAGTRRGGRRPRRSRSAPTASRTASRPRPRRPRRRTSRSPTRRRPRSPPRPWRAVSQSAGRSLERVTRSSDRTRDSS